MSFADAGQHPPQRPPRPPLSKLTVILVVIAVTVAVLAFRQGRISVTDLILIAVLVPSVIVHEVMHGVAAKRFGDNTARDAGRLTLNPLRHIDPFGTIILPFILALTTPVVFGYAKPVPVNVSHMTKNQSLAVSMAGPGINVVFAVLAIVVFKSFFTLETAGIVAAIVVFFGLINIVLAVFNSLPIPPLDGSAVIERFLPYRYLPKYLSFRRYSIFIPLAVLLFFPELLGRVIDPFLQWYDRVLR